jgi:hypothetical protein
MKSPTTSVSATSAWSSLTVTDAEVAAYVGHDIEVGYSPLGPGAVGIAAITNPRSTSAPRTRR